MNIHTLTPLHELTAEEKNSLGVTREILGLIDELGGNHSYLFIDKNEWAFPIIYMDITTSFEFRFTPFQDDWSDQSQLRRFKEKLVQYQADNPKILHKKGELSKWH